MVALKFALAVLGLTAEATRVKSLNTHVLDVDLDNELDSEDVLSAESADELMANTTAQIGYALGRLDFENDAALAADAPVRTWPSELDSKYTQKRLLACGFHGCAFLAEEKADGDEVVVKVASKGDGTQGAGAEECGRARHIHYSACGQGEAAAKAAQSYLPGCDGYGTLKNGAGYLVLPMAGGMDFNKFRKQIKSNPLPINEQKSVFAQLVAGIYGMHKSGVSHNDMHGKNVLINDKKQVAILDYGLGTTYPCSKRRNQNGYARDGNMFYAYTAMVSNCGKRNQWPGIWIGFVTDNGSYRRKQARCMEVLKEKWGIDQEFEDALQKVWTGNVERDFNQHFEELFNTKFVQQNLPASTTRFQLDGTDRCWTWDQETLKRKSQEAEVVPFTCK